ncbi:MAG: uroporphyrinogen-III synthase [Microthrixaceae bacterium]
MRSQVEALRGCDIVTFASASALRNLLEQVEPSEIPSLVVTIGPIASAEAARWGLKVAAEADPHTVEGLIEATVQAATARTATAQAATLRAQTEHS